MEAVNHCSHSTINHIFSFPDCAKLSTAEKVAIIAFHILTLGVPLILSKIYSCCMTETHTILDSNGNVLQKVAVNSVKTNSEKREVKTATATSEVKAPAATTATPKTEPAPKEKSWGVQKAETALKTYRTTKEKKDFNDVLSYLTLEKDFKAIIPQLTIDEIENNAENRHLNPIKSYLSEFSNAGKCMSTEQLKAALKMEFAQIGIEHEDLTKKCILIMECILKSSHADKKQIWLEWICEQLETYGNKMPVLLEDLHKWYDYNGTKTKIINELTVTYLVSITKKPSQEQQKLAQDANLCQVVGRVLALPKFEKQLADFKKLLAPKASKKPSEKPKKAKTESTKESEDKKSEDSKKSANDSKTPSVSETQKTEEPPKVTPKLSPTEAAYALGKEELEQASHYMFGSDLKAGGKIISGTYYCKNKDLSKIAYLQKKFDAELNTALKTHGKEAWKKPEVIEAADKVMKISYYAACEILNDLPAFLTDFSNENRSVVEVFNLVNSYQFEAFDHFTYTYHAIRSGKYRGKIAITLDDTKEKYEQECWMYREKIEDEAEFYKEGTKQNEWRNLYNGYCIKIATTRKEILTVVFCKDRVQTDNGSFIPDPEFHLKCEKEDVEHCGANMEATMLDEFFTKSYEEMVGMTSEKKGLAVARKTAVTPHPIFGTLEVHRFASKTCGFRRAKS